MTETHPDESAVVAAFWRVVEAHGWLGVTMRRVAAEGGQPLEAIRRHFPRPTSFVTAHIRLVDRAVLEGTVDDATSSPRDRLFDVLMRRLDAIQPNRAGILRFRDDLYRDPLTGLWLVGHLPRSMMWMLEAADIPTGGPQGQARAHGLGLVWMDTLRHWGKDESADLSATMAALDRALDRADRAAHWFGLAEGNHGTAQPETA